MKLTNNNNNVHCVMHDTLLAKCLKTANLTFICVFYASHSIFITPFAVMIHKCVVMPTYQNYMFYYSVLYVVFEMLLDWNFFKPGNPASALCLSHS